MSNPIMITKKINPYSVLDRFSYLVGSIVVIIAVLVGRVSRYVAELIAEDAGSDVGGE